MVTNLTAEELTKLHVVVTALPGFDPVGLRVYGANPKLGGTADDGICIASDRALVDDVVSDDILVAYDLNRPMWVSPAFASIDLADTATADRLARWVAGRARLAVTQGVRWVPLVAVGGKVGWALHGDMGGSCAFGIEQWFDTDVLQQLDHRDDRVLPDGSLYVDRCALVLVAAFLGAM